MKSIKVKEELDIKSKNLQKLEKIIAESNANSSNFLGEKENNELVTLKNTILMKFKELEILEEEIIKLDEDIQQHNDLYYNKNTPIISDAEYDRLILEYHNKCKIIIKLGELIIDLSAESKYLLKSKVKAKLLPLILSEIKNSSTRDIKLWFKDKEKTLCNNILDIEYNEVMRELLNELEKELS